MIFIKRLQADALLSVFTCVNFFAGLSNTLMDLKNEVDNVNL